MAAFEDGEHVGMVAVAMQSSAHFDRFILPDVREVVVLDDFYLCFLHYE